MVGGDGSLNEVVNGLLAGPDSTVSPPIAILAAGSGNDFGRHLGLRRGAGALADLLATGTPRSVDAWRLAWPGGGRWFLNVASFGFTGQAARIIDQRGKRFRGLSYVYGALLALLRHRDHLVRLRVDGGGWQDLTVCAGVLANTPWFGSRMHVAPGARSDDGRLDLLTVQGAGRTRLLGLLAGVFTARHLRSPAVHRRLVGRLALDWEGTLPVETDGEPVEVVPPLEVTCRPAALRVLVPGVPER